MFGDRVFRRNDKRLLNERTPNWGTYDLKWLERMDMDIDSFKYDKDRLRINNSANITDNSRDGISRIRKKAKERRDLVGINVLVVPFTSVRHFCFAMPR